MGDMMKNDLGIKALLCVAMCAMLSFVAGAASAGNMAPMHYKGRDYLFYTPSSLSQNQSAPLLIALHGGLGNADYMAKAWGINEVAERHGFRVAYLNGTGGRLRMMANKRTWNAGGCCGIAERENIDDVGYIESFINDMVRNNPVDANKIYLIGHSNGAMMAYRFVCERPGMVAAMVSVSGSLMVSKCSNARVYVLEIHGDADNNVPFKGGVGSKSITKVNYKSVDQTAYEMKRAGANFNVTLVPGGGHNFEELDSATQRKYSVGLGEMIAQFLNGKAANAG